MQAGPKYSQSLPSTVMLELDSPICLILLRIKTYNPYPEPNTHPRWVLIKRLDLRDMGTCEVLKPAKDRKLHQRY